ncbi:formin-like protein 5 [Panicum virgatum]|uniref:formin-like protein 5 n=1 Tax=Panicum virgatum TaxID=38727 RepID=UPI0019D5F510|nr:formin-like protein 5 [Panicum virgatum]
MTAAAVSELRLSYVSSSLARDRNGKLSSVGATVSVFSSSFSFVLEPCRAEPCRPPPASTPAILATPLDSPRPKPHHLALHLHHPSLSPFVPHAGRIKLPTAVPPLPSSPSSAPLCRTPISAQIKPLVSSVALSSPFPTPSPAESRATAAAAPPRRHGRAAPTARTPRGRPALARELLPRALQPPAPADHDPAACPAKRLRRWRNAAADAVPSLRPACAAADAVRTPAPQPCARAPAPSGRLGRGSAQPLAGHRRRGTPPPR